MAHAHRHTAGGLIRPDLSCVFTHTGITIMTYGDVVEIGIDGSLQLRAQHDLQAKDVDRLILRASLLMHQRHQSLLKSPHL